MTRNSRIAAMSFAAAIAASCGPPPEEDEIGGPPAAEAVRWWRSLSQDERNRRIVAEGARDIGAYVGLNCKRWLQAKVILNASRGAAGVPPTCPNAEGWYWCAGGSAIPMSADIRNVRPGWIVQMRHRNTPHTAIVYLRTADGIWWLDSNWVAPNTVGVHFERFADFERATCDAAGCRYSVYMIGGI